jgi:hypothetical protein
MLVLYISLDATQSGSVASSMDGPRLNIATALSTWSENRVTILLRVQRLFLLATQPVLTCLAVIGMAGFKD